MLNNKAKHCSRRSDESTGLPEKETVHPGVRRTEMRPSRAISSGASPLRVSSQPSEGH